MAINPNPWNPADEPVPIDHSGETVTLVDGQTFCMSRGDGDIEGPGPHGLYFADLRALDTVRLRADGQRLQALTSELDGSFASTFVSRAVGGDGHRALIVRRRLLAHGMREDIEVRNYGDADVPVMITLDVGTDFADLFAVKEGRARQLGEHSTEVAHRALVFRWRHEDLSRQVRASFGGDAPVTISSDGARWHCVLPPRSTCVLWWKVDVAFGDAWVETPSADAMARSDAVSRERLRAWSENAPVLRTDHTNLGIAYAKAVDDIGALRLFDPDGDGLPVVAAGAPWFMTLFGRDSLITSYMTLIVDPTLALGVLDALARLQGTRDDARTEEEPGRIMHEVRFIRSDAPTLSAGAPYYGSVDATPLFVVLLGELSRWGLPEADLRRLLPHADAALEWIAGRGDLTGRGYLEYQRRTPRGLANQGWKDSWDGVRFHDGRVADAPIALCEAQGYVYAAHLARAAIADRLGDERAATRHRSLADDLKQRFTADFWSDELGWLAMGLDGEGRRIDACASNMGHCLWAGIVDDELAPRVAEALLRPAMWSGWGLRTLASDEPAFDPTSYHCGSVWPHDNALCAAGLMRYGLSHEAHRIIAGTLDAARAWDGRMPELFCGVDRADIPTPIPYPTSCSPQAWAAASPLLYVRVLLGLEPDVPNGVLGLAPSLPPVMSSLELRGARLWDTAFDVTVDAGGVSVAGVPADLSLTGGDVLRR